MDFDFTTGGLLAGMLVSSVGFGLFVYGKRQERVPQLLSGLALMVYPMFLTTALPILGVGAAIVGGLWVALRSGM